MNGVEMAAKADAPSPRSRGGLYGKILAGAGALAALGGLAALGLQRDPEGADTQMSSVSKEIDDYRGALGDLLHTPNFATAQELNGQSMVANAFYLRLQQTDLPPETEIRLFKELSTLNNDASDALTSQVEQTKYTEHYVRQIGRRQAVLDLVTAGQPDMALRLMEREMGLNE